MPNETLTIPTDREHNLAGVLELPEGEKIGAALFAHCFTCTSQSRAAVTIARALARRGIACLRFDFTGIGESGGEFGTAGFPSDVEDVCAAARVLGTRFSAPVLLIGHSLGGAAVLAAAERMGADGIAAVATIGAPSDVPHVLGNIRGDLAAIERDGKGEVSIGGRPFTLDKAFFERTREADLLHSVRKMRAPLMICHSPVDEVVGIENAGHLFDAAIHPKSFLSLDGADHLLLDEADARFAAEVIGSWAKRYLAPGNG